MNRFSLKKVRIGTTPRKPLRSFKELAEEFGVSCQTLAAYGRQHQLPAPKLSWRSTAVSTTKWYDPEEMRAWWKSVQEKRSA